MPGKPWRRWPVSVMAAATLIVATSPRASAQVGHWSSPEPVSVDRFGAHRSSPAIAVEPSGALHAVWVEVDTGAGDEVRYAVSAPGQAHWGGSRRLSSSVPVGRSDPDVTVDASGNVHAVWVEERDGGTAVMHSMRSPGASGWLVAEPIRRVIGRSRQWSPAAAADRVGNAHFVWTDDGSGTPDVLHRSRDVGGRWSPVRRVHGDARGDQRDPALADAPGGEVVAVWQDTRDGTSHVYGSRLPQHGDAWWPEARLSSAVPGVMHRAPAVAADYRGRVVAVWIADAEGASAVRLSELHTYDPMRPYWGEDREVYRPQRGDALEIAAGGGPGTSVAAVWSESRPDGARIYAALIPAAPATLAPERVDASRAVTNGRLPDVGIDPAPRVHVVWRAVARAGGDDVVHALSAIARPQYGQTVQQGWLQYRPREPNCGSGSYVTVGCDGVAGPPILGGEPSLAALLGSYVTVRGQAVSEGPCPHVAVPVAALEPSPCPRETGSVTGRVTLVGQAVEGARVVLGEQVVASGPSGRFFLDRVPAGTHALTATLDCGLASVLPAVTVPRGFLATVGPASIVLGDVVPDCRVDLHDLVRAAAAYKSSPPYAPPCVDVDRDGAVTMADLTWIGSSYGAACPLAWQGAVPAVPAMLDGSPSGKAGLAGDATGLWLRDGTGVRAWEIQVALDVAPARAARLAAMGVAPFEGAGALDGSWIVDNRYDPATGRATLAVVVVAPAPPLTGAGRLAALSAPFRAAGRVGGASPRVAAVRLYGDGGVAAGGRIALDGTAVRPGPLLWLPWAFRGR